MDAPLELELLREANAVLLARNERLVDALGDMLALDPSPEDRQRAIAVWRKECGVAE
jgi:hypothetical protein